MKILHFMGTLDFHIRLVLANLALAKYVVRRLAENTPFAV
jgi:hypothetical protein